MKNWRSRLHSGWTLFTQVGQVTRLVWNCHPALTVVIVLTTLLQGLLPAATAYASKLVVDSVVGAIGDPAGGWDTILPAVALAFGLGVVGALVGRAAGLAQELLGNRLYNHINEMVISHAISLDLSFYENPTFYDMLQRAQSEAGFRPLSVLARLLTLASSTITISSLLALLLRFNPWIVLALVLTVLPALFVQARYGRRTFRLLSGRAPESRQLFYYTQLLTSEQSVKEIKLFNLAPLFLERYRALFARFYRQDRALTIRRQLFGAALSLLSQAGYYGCYVYVIARVVVGAITLGDLTLYGTIFRQLQSSLMSLLDALTTMYENLLFLSNLSAFLELRPVLSENGTQAPSEWQEGLVFHDVSFRYPGAATCALRNVSLHVRPGEKIALVGENGAGKTTLVKLLTRLYDPTEGYITLDGVDLREYDLKSLQKRIGVIFQDYVRYYLPARENIGLGQVDRLDDMERIVAAAKKSKAHDTISQLPSGYDTILGRWFDEGSELSWGEWQKVALARAFVRDAELLILDEPTASLDARAEYQVFQRFSELIQDRAAVLISHRFSTVRMADRIVVLRDGEVVERGTHSQLVAQEDGLYARLFAMQAEPYVELYNHAA
jgi:ATP-binding cassette subfamily B protein